MKAKAHSSHIWNLGISKSCNNYFILINIVFRMVGELHDAYMCLLHHSFSLSQMPFPPNLLVLVSCKHGRWGGRRAFQLARLSCAARLGFISLCKLHWDQRQSLMHRFCMPSTLEKKANHSPFHLEHSRGSGWSQMCVQKRVTTGSICINFKPVGGKKRWPQVEIGSHTLQMKSRRQHKVNL